MPIIFSELSASAQYNADLPSVAPPLLTEILMDLWLGRASARCCGFAALLRRQLLGDQRRQVSVEHVPHELNIFFGVYTGAWARTSVAISSKRVDGGGGINILQGDRS